MKDTHKLDFDEEYSLFADALNWILAKKQKTKEGDYSKDKAGNHRYTNIGYYSNLSHLLNSLIQLKSKRLNVRDLNDVIEQIKTIENKHYEQLSNFVRRSHETFII